MMFSRTLVLLAALAGLAPAYTFESARQFLTLYCSACHSGAFPQLSTPATLRENPARWTLLLSRVHNAEMPPKNAPAPPSDAREEFTGWLRDSLKREACAAGIVAGPSPLRRLNRAEYGATIRDLLNLHIDVANALPADGAGGEGFDNAAETLFLSPIHAEKYLDAAKLALDYAAKDPRSAAKFMIAKSGPGVSPRQAAQTILEAFLPRAFRRPYTKADLDLYMGLYDSAISARQPFSDAVLYALRGVLVSPQFLFRVEPKPLDDYALASRLSYFLWGTMPDGLLFALAETNKLHEPEIYRRQVERMLRNGKSYDFTESFVEQWLGTRTLGQTMRPDAKAYPAYNADEELQGDIRYQPVMFFRELLVNDLSLLNLIDSKFTMTTKKLQKLYGLNIAPARGNNSSMPQRVELPAGSDRGGLLGMTAVLAISSHPHRTSPVLRGKWILDAMLGTPPPPPPPNVPPLEESSPAAAPKTMREMLTRHRENPVCAGCHSRMDPLGFALENYDVLGRWRSEEAGKPVDAKGELPDGTAFEGPAALKAVLMERKDVFLHNLSSKMLGYALGRGLTLQDSCVVDAIAAEVKANDYKAQSLIRAVAMSVPFRQTGAPKQPSPQ